MFDYGALASLFGANGLGGMFGGNDTEYMGQLNQGGSQIQKNANNAYMIQKMKKAKDKEGTRIAGIKI